MDSGRDDVDELNVPVVEMAKELGNVKTANIIALAAFVARSGIVEHGIPEGVGEGRIFPETETHSLEHESHRCRYRSGKKRIDRAAAR